MGKNIVICLDGTGNEFGDRNSNVVKLFSLLNKDSKYQEVYYHPGLGTAGEVDKLSRLGRIKLSVKKLFQSMFGYGIFENLKHTYEYLMDNYEPEDKLFIFGFSRGAYTAKALCSMLYMFGLLARGNKETIDYLIKMLKKTSPEDFERARKLKAAFSTVCKPHFVGLWDTVSSVGGFNPIHIPYTQKSPDIFIGRHAVSIDETRSFFRENLWEPVANQDIKEVWFPGVHSDVGGGYFESESALSDLSLEWMIKEAQKAGLKFENIQSNKHFLFAPKYNGLMHNESEKFFWRIIELIPRPVSFKKPDSSWTKRWRWLWKEPRTIPENSIFHESVQARVADRSLRYAPRNLPEVF